MNQILSPQWPNEDSNIYLYKNSKKFSSKIYRILFLFFSTIAIIMLILLFIRIHKQNSNETTSQKLTNIYQLSTLYSNDVNYTASQLSTDNTNKDAPFVIGMLKIDKINLNYPILSESNADLLELSVCRFAGPMPNQPGNLCIAGHNYVDYKLFSRLNELEIDDKIQIYDLSGKMVEYTIFHIYEVYANDLSCTSQNTNGNKIVTLLTCNNVTQKRLVLVAK